MSADPDPEDLPIYTHHYVLGADIGVAQADTHTHDYSGHRTRETAVDVTAYGSDRTRDRRQRRYLAAWARRNLFRTQMQRPADTPEVPA